MNSASTTRSANRGLVICFVAAITLSAAFGQRPSSAPEYYAGIEIGAKGVKATVIEIGSLKRPMEAISNTTIAQGVAKSGKFSAGAIRDTAEEAGKFAERIRDEFKVPPDRVCVVGSSGLPPASNRDDLVKAVSETTKLAPMTFLVPAEEVRLTIKGLLTKESELAQALLVDVGSGNTKGGFLGADNKPVDFSIPFGSVTFANRVAMDASSKQQPFPESADQLRPIVLEAELAKQVAAHPELKDRGLVFLTGGAAYALTTLMKPEAVLQTRVDVTVKDIAAYKKLVATSPIPPPSLDQITDPKIRAAAEKEVKNVLDTFTPQNLIAGSEILTALSSTLNLEGKTLQFDRTAVTAWIRAKALEQAPKVVVIETQKTTVNTPEKPAFKPAPKSPVYPSPQTLPD